MFSTKRVHALTEELMQYMNLAHAPDLETAKLAHALMMKTGADFHSRPDAEKAAASAAARRA